MNGSVGEELYGNSSNRRLLENVVGHGLLSHEGRDNSTEVCIPDEQETHPNWQTAH